MEEIQKVYDSWRGSFIRGDSAMYEIGKILNKKTVYNVKIYAGDSKLVGEVKEMKFSIK